MNGKKSSAYSRRVTNLISMMVTALIVSSLMCVGIVEFLPRMMERYKPFVAYIEPPYLTNPNGTRATAFVAGRGVVLNLTGIREPYECWGEYITILKGPVTVFLPVNNSAIISEKRVTYKLPVFFQLPADLPAGEYEWTRMVKPTCHGTEMRPFHMDMFGLKMTIVRPEGLSDARSLPIIDR